MIDALHLAPSRGGPKKNNPANPSELERRGGMQSHYTRPRRYGILAPDIPDESVLVGALLGEITTRNMTYKTNPEATTMNLAVRSLYLIANRIELTEDEAQAIVAHDGINPVSGGVNNLDYHHRECRLQMIVHFADKWTAAVDEEGRK